MWKSAVRFLLLAAAFLMSAIFFSPALEAQEGTISGRVLSQESGLPLAAARIQVSGTNTGTITDARGGFTLQVPAGTHLVVVTSLGYTEVQRTVDVATGQTVTTDFSLRTRAFELDGVVATVGATQARRVEFGTDIERLSAAAATERAAITNVSELLKGRAAGVAILPGSGEAGTGSRIRVRGATSLTGSNNPIIIMDGIRISNETGGGPGSIDFANGQTISRLDDLNPKDIESIQIMKGPTAAALYGSEAAAGVIIIETKQGFQGHQFSLSVEQGFDRDVAPYEDNYFNLTQFGGFRNINDPVIQQFNPIQHPLTGAIYARQNPLRDPLTRPFRTGLATTTDLSLRGGQQDLTYFTSFRLENREGVLPNNGLDRTSVRANLEARPAEILRLGVSSSFVSSTITLPDNDRSGYGFITNGGAGSPRFGWGRRPDGSRGDCLLSVISGVNQDEQCERREGNLTASFDKLASIRNEQSVGRFMGSVTADLTPINWLSNRLSVGIDHAQIKNYNLVPLDPGLPLGVRSRGDVRDIRTTERILSADYAMTATTRVTDLESVTTLGAQYFGRLTDIVGCTGIGGFAAPEANACDASLTFSGLSDRLESREAGVYLQQRLGWQNKVFGTFGLRMDDNSAFGSDEDAILSPSVNLSAVLSEMDFWNFQAINHFRLRGALGTAAQAPRPFAQIRTYRPVRVLLEGTQQQGMSPLAPGNPNLTAERNRELELGFDAGLLEDRLTFKFTVYDQEVRDAIVSSRVAPSTGFAGTQFVNVGRVTNRGIEALLGATVLSREGVSLDIDVRMSTQNPIIRDLGGTPPVLSGVWGGMFREGYAPGAHYGPVIQSATRRADGTIDPASIVLAPGEFNDPSRPNDRFLGVQTPTNEQSLSSTLTLRNNLRIYTLFDRAAGHHKVNHTDLFRSPFTPEQNGSRTFAFRQVLLTPEEQAGVEARGDLARWVFTQKADFIKWREVTLAYTVPGRFVPRGMSVQRLSLNGGVRNLATWTDYTGMDPEGSMDGGSDSFANAEFFTLPPTRSFFIRVAVDF
jgi:TonB-dependent starch-binding outer membrane protein SusC